MMTEPTTCKCTCCKCAPSPEPEPYPNFCSCELKEIAGQILDILVEQRVSREQYQSITNYVSAWLEAQLLLQ